jgi:hypothetical protein
MQHPTGTKVFKCGSETIDDRSHAQTYRPLITSLRTRLESISRFLQATGTDKPLGYGNECLADANDRLDRADNSIDSPC